MKLRLLFLPLAALIVFSIPACADSVATINVTASLIPSSTLTMGGVSAVFQPPSLFVTGQILFDLTNGIQNLGPDPPPNGSVQMNMSFLGPGGATSQFSTQGTGYCIWLGSGAQYGECFYHAQVGSASVSFGTIIFSPTFTVGESWGACAVRDTDYLDSGVHEMGQGPCPRTSTASFDNNDGVVYTLLDNSSSGRLTVAAINEVNVPEPSSLCLFTTGLLMTIGLAFRKARLSL